MGRELKLFLNRIYDEVLEEDFDGSKEDLWNSRQEYQLFPWKAFRKHVAQAIRTRKYLHTLRTREEAALRKGYERAMGGEQA